MNCGATFSFCINSDSDFLLSGDIELPSSISYKISSTSSLISLTVPYCMLRFWVMGPLRHHNNSNYYQCSSRKSLKQIHAQMIVQLITEPKILLKKAIKFHDLEYSHLLFFHMNPDEYCYTIMMVLCQLGIYTLIASPSSLAWSGQAQQLHFPFLFHILCQPREYPASYGQLGKAKEVVEAFSEMVEAGFTTDNMSLLNLLKAAGDLGDLDLGRLVEEFSLKNDTELDSYLGSALINLYSRCGNLVSA
ncbi:hypothetical protein RJT34_14429 [Clitoria ternatea]|uniref:Pentatricopeptide repeat-containing protein n=1 Tax=Clitoria ternatea TaxID=43366 RepID=A0AAN9JQQ2_CLITE